MPKQKDLKRRVRARMRKTGESYTAARSRLVEKRKPAPEAAPPPGRDLAALAGLGDAVVESKTGRTWRQWVDVLDRAGAAELTHTEIAELVHRRHGVPGWWSQAVTVGYERIRGLREKGQRRDGSFEVSKSKTYPVPIADLWAAFLRCKLWLAGETLRTSKATKHKTMRLRFSDGTPVEAYFAVKGPHKSSLTIQHRKLASRDDAAQLRRFWAERLEAIGELLAGGG
jgi:hypothetical protein